MLSDRRPLRTLAAAAAAALLAAPALAGVTVVENVRSGGFHGFGAYATKRRIEVDGNKSRQEDVKKHTGAVLGFFSRHKGKATDTILRLDLDKRWVLDPKHKRYREFPITLPPDQKAEMENAERGRPERGREGKAEKPTARIVKNEFKVERTSERKTLHGFPARLYKVSYLLEVEDLKTKHRVDYKMKADYWTTPWTKELRSAEAQREAFAKAYLKKLGLGELPSDPKSLGLSMMAMMTAANPKDVAKSKAEFRRKIGKIHGFPVLIATRWYGAQMQGAGQAAEARKEAAENEESGDRSAHASEAGDLASGNVGGAVAGFFGHLAAKAAAKRARKEMAGGPGKPVFSARVEVLSVKVGSVPASAFEIPKGYKKKA